MIIEVLEEGLAISQKKVYIVKSEIRLKKNHLHPRRRFIKLSRQ
jgi:hypothetical protein